MILIPNDTIGIAKGRNTPANAPLVDLIQEKGEVTVYLYGDINFPLKLVKKPNASFQAFGATEADRATLGKLYQNIRGQQIEVTLVGQ